MKVNRKVITLMALMAAGVAAAEGTLANTPITNTATATYDVPGTNPGDPVTPGTATSNTVTTTVLPKPDFDIIFTGNTPTDGGTQTDLDTTTKVITGAVPGGSYSTPYTLLNNGNVALTVNLAADTTDAASGQTVAYYPKSADTNNDGSLSATEIAAATAITSLTVAADNPATGTDEGFVDFFQVVTIPATATPTQTFGASPEGTVTGTGLTATANGYTTGSTNYEEAKPVNTDLQFTKVTMFTPSLDNNPTPTTPPTTPTTPSGTPNTPPAVGTVTVPTLPGGSTDTTPNTPPVAPAVPGYPDAAGTPIVPDLAGDNQIAYPKADADNNPDVVTFTNTLKNNGTSSDTVQLFPTDAVNPDGTLKPGYTFTPATATFTRPDGTTVQFLDPSGNPIPTAPGALFPTMTVPAGATAYYQTRVTYPDPDDSSNIEPIVVNIGADSLNDSGVVPETTTTDTIYPPAAQFGDSTTTVLGTVPTPAPIQTVTPSGTFDSSPIDSPNVSDSTATFPMDLANLGEYSDTFKLSGTVTFGTTTVPVKYYDAAGNLLPTDTAGNYISPVVGPDSEIVVYAVVDVPAGTPTGDYTVNQSATGYYSTIPMTDTNDIIRVAPLGSVALAKFTQDGTTAAGATPQNGINNPVNYTANNTTAKPGDTINYQIIGKNNYNTAVAKFAICDVVPANTTFSSVTLSPAPSRVIYNVNNGGWSTTAPAAGLAEGTTVCIAPDTNSDNVPDALAAGATLTANFAVVVK